jgi:demethylmenaquinone methyltransferase / 2-methoxy-6-polyprenyl-1,4-benzoquinol methylase
MRDYSPLAFDFARNYQPIVNSAYVREVFGSIAARYDLANHLLSGGLDFLWRKRSAEIVADWKPALVLDLATGSGDLALALQKKLPETSIIGADFSLPMLDQALRKGFGRLVNADAMHLPFPDETFDVITVAFGLRNMESWEGALREMSRVLTKGGHLLVLDFSIPPQPLQTVYRWYLHHLLPRFAAVVTGDKAAYDYLGASIETFPHGEAMRKLINENGFSEATCEPLTGGIVSLYTGRRT